VIDWLAQPLDRFAGARGLHRDSARHGGDLRDRVTRLAAAGQRERPGGRLARPAAPLALVFGLLVGFLAVEVWSNSSSAQHAVDTEASAPRSVDLLTATSQPPTSGEWIC